MPKKRRNANPGEDAANEYAQNALMHQQTLYPVLSENCRRLSAKADSIPESRKNTLQELANYIARKVNARDLVSLVFVCTHNSRRSVLGQAWALAAARFYGFNNLQTFSGGTEVSAVYPQILAQLQEAGYSVYLKEEGTNPIYHLRTGNDEPEIPLFSKVYNHGTNPTTAFAAIMTCSEADGNCPFIPGAEARFSCPYEDPKQSDGSPDQTRIYRERSEQIAREMLFVFSMVARAVAFSKRED